MNPILIHSIHLSIHKKKRFQFIPISSNDLITFNNNENSTKLFLNKYSQKIVLVPNCPGPNCPGPNCPGPNCPSTHELTWFPTKRSTVVIFGFQPRSIISVVRFFCTHDTILTPKYSQTPFCEYLLRNSFVEFSLLLKVIRSLLVLGQFGPGQFGPG